MPKEKNYLYDLAQRPEFINCPLIYRPADGLEIDFRLTSDGKLRREGIVYANIR